MCNWNNLFKSIAFDYIMIYTVDDLAINRWKIYCWISMDLPYYIWQGQFQDIYYNKRLYFIKCNLFG